MRCVDRVVATLPRITELMLTFYRVQYMLKKLQKALTMRRAIDSYVLEDFHTMHCSMVMMDPYFHEDVQCTPEMVCPTWVRATWTACIQV